MKSLIRHFLTHNRNEILINSTKNFLVTGLHRIPLHDKLTLYVTTKDHEMWLNSPELYKRGMTFGFHRDETNKTIEVVQGCLRPWIVEQVYSGDVTLNRYVLIASARAFVRLDRENVELKTIKSPYFHVGRAFTVKSKDIHTFSCPKGQVTAWLEMEGEPVGAEDLTCWSNDPPDLSEENLNERFSSQQEIWGVMTSIKDL